ncbi:MAG: SDR family NAD(P)-dependent oxidoreductase [Pseudomonadales bacterium]
MKINPQGVLAGQVALVTGASRGIGDYIARRYAMEGAKVVVSARTTAKADHVLPGNIDETVVAIRKAGGEAVAVQADLAVADEREALLAAAKECYGDVDILVNNAAITYFFPVVDFPEKRYRLMFEVQVRAPFELSQMLLPGMLERGRGWILNISSHAAIHPEAAGAGLGGTVYGMCKAALERFTTGLAQETYGRGIGVNVISPGLVATPGAVHHNLINEGNKDTLMSAEGMAEACLRLVHGDSKLLTGRIDYAEDVIKEFGLIPVALI